MTSDKTLAATVKSVDLSTLPKIPMASTTNLPTVSCVYFLFLDTRLMYIGTTVNLNQRMKTHHLRYYKRAEFEQAVVAWWGTRDTLLEYLFILLHQPVWNRETRRCAGAVTQRWLRALGIQDIEYEATVAVDLFEHECKRCQHEWQSVNKRPVVCPRCKSYSWDTLKKKAGK